MPGVSLNDSGAAFSSRHLMTASTADLSKDFSRRSTRRLFGTMTPESARGPSRRLSVDRSRLGLVDGGGRKGEDGEHDGKRPQSGEEQRSPGQRESGNRGNAKRPEVEAAGQDHSAVANLDGSYDEDLSNLKERFKEIVDKLLLLRPAREAAGLDSGRVNVYQQTAVSAVPSQASGQGPAGHGPLPSSGDSSGDPRVSVDPDKQASGEAIPGAVTVAAEASPDAADYSGLYNAIKRAILQNIHRLCSFFGATRTADFM